MITPAPNGSPRGRAYRPEIDGIRAIAVMAVLIFHAGIDAVPAGFLGVDIFFVISGFLITGILARELETGTFSLLRFYERRARRILPALLAVCLVSVVPAYFLMLPSSLEDFGESLLATLLFSNNLLLYLSADYFEAGVEFKPLMHTWSLGLEEQFYLFAPLALYLLHRLRGRGGVVVGLYVITVASFAFSVWAAQHAPRANFYLLPSRAWQLGAGALVAVSAFGKWPDSGNAQRGRALLAALGLAMVLAPMLVLTADTPMPSWPTLVPVVGTCLILLFSDGRDPVGRLLASRPFVAIGLISYSAYLIHQPLFALVRLSALSEPDTGLMALLIVPTLLAAYASWRWVEQPFRKARTMPLRRLVILLSAGSLLGIAVSLAFYLSAGLPGRWRELAHDPEGASYRNSNAYNLSAGRYRDKGFDQATEGGRKILVIGDSFARDFINSGVESGALAGAEISLSQLLACQDLAADRPALAAAARADFIVLAFKFDEAGARCIADYHRQLAALGPARLMVMSNPSFGWSNDALMRLAPADRYRFRAEPLDHFLAANQAASQLLPGDAFVDRIGILADEHGKVPVFTPDGKWISQDATHLTRAGAGYVGRVMFQHPNLRALASAARPPVPVSARDPQ